MNIRKKLTALAALLLCLCFLCSCSFIEGLISDALESLLEEYTYQNATEAATEAHTEARTFDTEVLTEDTEEITDEPEETFRHPVYEPFEDTYVPSYPGGTVRAEKTADPVCTYWKNTLTKQNEIAAYERIEKMFSDKTASVEMNCGISFNDIKRVYRLFTLDHPEFFWNGTSYSATGYVNDIDTFILSNTTPADRIPAMQAQLEAQVKEILALIPDGASDIEAELIIFDWLADNVEYVKDAENSHSIYGALVDRECVCEGYAEAFQYLCMRAGVPAVSIDGIANNSVETERHKWCAAQIGGKWYLVDPTWGHGKGPTRYLYFNNSAYISESHDPDQTDLPDLSFDHAEYLRYYGLCFEGDGDFDDVFMRALYHYVSLIPKNSASARIMIKASDAETAEKYAELIEEEGDRISELFSRFNTYSDTQLIVFGDTDIKGDCIITFIICRY